MWASFEQRVLTEDPLAFRVRVLLFQYACCLQAEMYRFAQVTVRSSIIPP